MAKTNNFTEAQKFMMNQTANVSAPSKPYARPASATSKRKAENAHLGMLSDQQNYDMRKMMAMA